MSALPQTLAALRTLLDEVGPEQMIRRFRRPPLPSRLLRELMVEATADETLFIALYPLSPSDLLESLATQDPEPEVAAALAANPRTPPPVLLPFIEHPEARVRGAVAGNPNLTSREITRLLQDNHGEVVRALAVNPGLKSQHQAFLIRHPDPAVRAALANNTNLEPLILCALGEDASPLIRRYTAAVSKADETLQLLWADGDDEDQQLGLLNRRKLSDPVIRSLALSRHAAVRERVRQKFRLREPELVYRVDFGTEEEQIALAADPALPIPLQHALCGKDSARVRESLAGNPGLAPEVLEYIQQMGEEAEWMALLNNPAREPQWIIPLARSGGPRIQAFLMQDEDLAPTLAAELINHRLSAEATVHLAASRRPFPELRSDLARALARHPIPSFRALAASSHHLLPATLRRLAGDPVPYVGETARANPRFSPSKPDEDIPTYREEPAVTAWLQAIEHYLTHGFPESTSTAALPPEEIPL